MRRNLFEFRPFEIVIDFLSDLKIGVQNIIKYIPIIYKDRDWDQCFLFKLLQFKLLRMEDLFINNGHLESNERNAKQMRVCINLLDRIIKDEYYENVFKNHDKKWGGLEFGIEENETCTLLRLNTKTKEDKKQERKEYRILSDKLVRIQKQDIDMLFLNIRKHIQEWWD